MNKKLLSALLAVMMVVSMMACIAVPATAAETLPADAVHISTITTKETTGRNIYINAPADFITLANAHINKYLYYLDTIYLANDIDMSTYVSPTAGNTFADDYTAMTYNKSGAVNWNGLGHTIYNWTETGSIYAEYGFENNVGAPTSIDVSFKNLNMVGATITGGVGAVLLAKCNADSGYGGNITIENCHVYNCTASSSSNYYTAGIIGRVDGDDRVNITIKNCSVIGNNFSLSPASATAKTEANGLFVGRAECNTVTIENCLAANNTLGKLTAGVVNSSGGLVVGDAKVCTGGYVFNNIALINNTVEVLGDCYDAVLVNPYNTTSAITATNVYAVGNVKSTDDASTADDVAIKAWVNDSANKNATVTLTNCLSDNVQYGVYTSVEDNTAADASSVISNLSAEAVLNEMNANVPTGGLYWTTDATKGFTATETAVASNYTVKFVTDDGIALFVADATGKVTFEAADKAALSTGSWTLNGAPAVIDFDNLILTEDTVYQGSAHTNHIEAIPGDNANHKVVCNDCTEANHNYTVACADVTTTGTPVAGDYYNAAKTAYTCVCGNTWDVVDANYTAEAPITVTMDNSSYGDNAIPVAVTVGAKADAKLAGFVATVTFDAAKLEYVDFTTAFNCAVNAANAANGTLTIAFAPADGLNLNAEALVLNFKTKEVANDTTVDVQVTITETNVDTGSNIVDTMMPLTTSASASAAVTHVNIGPVPTFTAGDVNQDGEVDLMDGVMVIQALKDTIYESQKASFQIWAADVDGDNTVTVNDITILLKNATGDEVTLVKATTLPTIIVPTV